MVDEGEESAAKHCEPVGQVMKRKRVVSIEDFTIARVSTVQIFSFPPVRKKVELRI